MNLKCLLGFHDYARIREPHSPELEIAYKKWMHERREKKEQGLVHRKGWCPEKWEDEVMPSYDGGYGGSSNSVCINCGKLDLGYDKSVIDEMDRYGRKSEWLEVKV